jgi:ubiquinone/menaquinone biosynthesis C-methylase UbiE
MVSESSADRSAAHAAAHQTQSSAGWLDTHFAACAPEYAALLRWVELQPGWRVLDAGCGSGSYLALLAEAIGPSGQLTALDLQQANLDTVAARLAATPLPCPIALRPGSVGALPFADGSFDAVWCANTTQYFADDGLPAVLAELRRVVRPGGVVAVKDVDMTLARLYPADPFLLTRLSQASVQGADVAPESIGSLRGRVLRRWLERAGLHNVRQQTLLIERWAPLAPDERTLWTEWMALFARLAVERGVPNADQPIWRSLADADAPDNPINAADFYCCEGQVVCAGVVPG